jgi:agmatine deiminase
VAYPWDGDEWGPWITGAQQACVALCGALAGAGEAVELLVASDAIAAKARAALAEAGVSATLHAIRYGDVWLRDTGPLFVVGDDGQRAAACFDFNGWGGKYLFEHDPGVAAAIADAAGVPTLRADFVFEGGAIDVDGAGRCLTTRQCLLNPNRNPGLSQAAIEARLAAWLGVDEVIWLGDGLAGDHTDGHVDNLARFVAPGVVAVMEARTGGDPNADCYRRARAACEAAGLEVVVVPSPGRVEGADGAVMAASHMNFVIANEAVIVPLYRTTQDDAALAAIAGLFPGRRVVGLDARAVLTGGGAFHCVTREEPAR